MAPSSGTGSIGGTLRDRRSSRIKSSRADTPLVEFSPDAIDVGSFRPNESVRPGRCAGSPGVSAPKDNVRCKPNNRISVFRPGALSRFNMRSPYHNPAERQPWFWRSSSRAILSRSERTNVAVGLSPRTVAKHTIRRRGATAERSNRTVAFNRRSATRDGIARPWTEVHGYHHGLAPRGETGLKPGGNQTLPEAEVCPPATADSGRSADS